MRMLLKRKVQIEKFGSSGRCCLRNSIMLVKEDHSTPLQHHLASLRMTGWYLILWLMMIAIDRWSELPISSTSVHDVLVDQLRPQSDKSGALSFPVLPLVRVAEPSLRTCRSSLMILSVIL